MKEKEGSKGEDYVSVFILWLYLQQCSAVFVLDDVEVKNYQATLWFNRRQHNQSLSTDMLNSIAKILQK